MRAQQGKKKRGGQARTQGVRKKCDLEGKKKEKTELKGYDVVDSLSPLHPLSPFFFFSSFHARQVPLLY
jgi:hypothetical protein